MIMLDGFVFNFGDLLNQLEGMGFFSYILPFLLIFGFVYAILVNIKLFQENRGASLIVALAVGLLSLQLNIVSSFFQVLMPNLGVGLGILLVGLVLAGVFIGDLTNEDVFKWIFFALGAMIFIFVLLISFSDWRFLNEAWSRYRGIIVAIILIAAGVSAIVVMSKSKGGGGGGGGHGGGGAGH